MSEPNPTLLTHVSDADFETEVLQSKGALVVDFWAPWCAPCRFLGATLEELAPEFSGQVRIAKLNVDDSPRTAAAFGVPSIPTMFFFRDGQPIGATTGALPADVLRDLFRRHAAGTLGKKNGASVERSG